ncbi:MAG: GNAT family N-acetyltransferase [Pirellulales bacterium]|nr:GNAT family N-acetyltransferase [Pirellulales bacterium]
MEADLLIPRRPPVLPEGYRLVAWNEALLDAHARTKYRSFCDEIDAVVFPCLGDLEGCRRLMREIRRKPGFLAEATWLIARVVAPSQHSWCGTIQGVVDKQGTGMIQNVGVVPGHRGIGLGTLLVLQAMAGFGRAGLRKASLEVTAENTSAAQLYRRLGFRRARTVYKVVDDKARAASRGTAVSRSSDTTQSASHGEAMLSHS